MPKFLLPPNTFPTLVVSDDDADAIITLSSDFVDEAMTEHAAFLAAGRSVDDARWKSIKTRDGVTVYQDRSFKVTKSSTFENDATVGSMAFSTKLHGLLGVGQIDGQLDDMLYGLLRTTREMMQIKSVYMDDKGGDAKILADLISPTPEDPFRSLQLMWSASEFNAGLMSRIVRPRDFVYLESLGIRENADGERVGYILMHSITIPGVRELSDYQMVRGSFSFCGLYRQLPNGKLDFFMKGFVDSAGDIHKSIMIPATAEAMLSFRRSVYCGQMKKLNYALKTQKSVIVDLVNAQCCSCSNKLKPAVSSNRDKVCEICMSRSCVSCAQTRALAFYSSSRRGAVTKRVIFCRRCLDNALALSGFDIAAEEARRQNPFSAFELSSDSNGSGVLSPTDSASVDISREFFG